MDLSARYLPIECYGIIGNMETVALVGEAGSIDFMCYPRFDSPSIFAALLDCEKGGRFRIRTTLGEVATRQMYLPDSNILLTRFLSAEGVAEISDYMPVDETKADQTLVRRVKSVRGNITFEMECSPRFNYARTGHTVSLASDQRSILFTCSEPTQPNLRLRSDVPMQLHDGDAHANFTLRSGTHATFVLVTANGHESDSVTASRTYASESFKRTLNYWRRWIGRSQYKGRWREQVDRSALLLKLLTSRQFGSIVAAPTFGLPEEIGGIRNWDYRYTWIRDASFTLYALMRLGYTEEASAFTRWLEERVHNVDGRRLQLMYGIDGRSELQEVELPHLEGYRGSRPVRIGNAAYQQSQNDIYGVLMDSLYLYDRMGDALHYDLWSQVVLLLEWVVANWRKPDHGIWEVRGGEKEFLYTRLMHWVALDRACRLALKRSFPAPLEQWRKCRDEIHHDIYRNFWDSHRGAFVQYRGGRELDASTLLMPLVRFISPTDPRWLSTVRAIEHDLLNDSMVYRYRTQPHDGIHPLDGLEGSEGTFSICSFWYVECLSRAGDLQQARFLFEKMLGYANHLGLYAEELGNRGEHLGNFPQAFTHLALISAAYDLDRRLNAAGWQR